MSGFKGPLPGPGFKQQMAQAIESPLIYQQSGELTATKNIVLGTPRRSGRISDAFLSLGEAGKDDTNPLSLELDVKIDGTSIFTTKPKILHISGEAAGDKSTVAEGDGITEGVIDGDLSEYSAGDVIMGKLTVTRSATPSTEMQDAAVVVVLNPK